MIPEIGSKLKLVEDWTFSLFWEPRNTALLLALETTGNIVESNFVPTQEEVICYRWSDDALGKYYDKYFAYNYHNEPWRTNNKHSSPWVMGQPYCYKCTIPKDSILIIDRYYIKKGNGAFSSITFRTEDITLPGFKKKKPRFWAKLYEVNGIVYEPH